MAIEITKRFVVKAPPAAVWGFLTDPQRVAHCMPGAAITDRIDEKTFAGTMAVKVGPVSTSYKGKVVFERLDEGTRTAEIVATVQDVSDHLFQVFSQCMRAELETAAAAPAPAPAATAPATSAAPVAAAAGSRGAAPEALDLGSLGAKVAGLAAGRAIRRPAFWVAVAAAAVLLYLLFR